MAKIVVVGAGVTGLTTAYLLSEKGHDVTILAKKFSYDGYDPYFCSNHAGANWHSFATSDDFMMQEYDKPAYFKFLHLLETEPRSGVVIKKHMNYVAKDKYEQMNGNFTLPWFTNFVEGFRILDKSELPPDVGFGWTYKGVVINTSVYLSYMFGKCLDNGVLYKRKTLSHIEDAKHLHLTGLPAAAVVNCTGLSSKFLKGVEDNKLVSIKGQVILVENSCPDYVNVNILDQKYPYEKVYLMPRKEGGTIIGGSTYPGDYNEEVDLGVAERFKERALKYCPLLVDPKYGNPPTLQLVRHMVGFRPGRKGGVRIEKDPKIKYLVHNYGIGGSGFQSSYGTCARTVELVEEVLTKPKL